MLWEMVSGFSIGFFVGMYFMYIHHENECHKCYIEYCKRRKIHE